MFIFGLFASLLVSVGFGQSIDWSEFDATVALKIELSTGYKTICSGTFLDQKNILTAAHCLQDAVFVDVVLDKEVGVLSSSFSAKTWEIIPSYSGNQLGKSVDLGIVQIRKKSSKSLHFPVLSDSFSGTKFERIGYGTRSEVNRRTHITSFLRENFRTYISLEDLYGYPGDSGGPIYQRRNGKLFLVGVHTGRAIAPDGSMLQTSYAQLITPDLLIWVQSHLSRPKTQFH